VYDVAGREVVALVDGHRPSGPHSVQWAGRDAAGVRVPAGVYFYVLEAGDFTETRRMTIVR
jgi:hypothetical protein